MLTHGETGPARADGLRPRAHDSDEAAPAGFGLLQRRQDFAVFQDQEARYDLRPGKWIEPLGGDWGAGRDGLACSRV